MQSTTTAESNGTTHDDSASGAPSLAQKARVQRDQSVTSADYSAAVRDMLAGVAKSDQRAALDALVAVTKAGDPIAALAAFAAATTAVRHIGTLRAIGDGIVKLAPMAARCQDRDAATVHAAFGAMLG